MKKLIALFLLLALMLPLASCASELPVTETATQTHTDEAKETENKNQNNGKIVYPEGFSVGYARVDVTPTTELTIYNGKASEHHDPLQLTCTAVCDGESAALLISLDVRSFREDVTKMSQRLIETAVDIPADRVLINATHTHSAPAPGFDGEDTAHWVEAVLYKKLVLAAKEALRDLTPAEAFVGTSHTKDITFVRRYLTESGKYVTNASAANKPIAHESEADNEMRVIRFEREGKKDVVMVNYQTHYGDAPTLYPSQYSADFVHDFREAAEKEWNCHFTYHSGASGNLNFRSPIAGERKYNNHVEATKKVLMPTAKEALDKAEKVATGPLRSASSLYPAAVMQDSEERLAHAKQINSLRNAGKNFEGLLDQYGFASKYEATSVIMRAGLGKVKEIPFTAISFGEIAFVSAPYEMFDTNGMEVRSASPFKTTFICSLTNGSFGYVPSALAVPHGSYEVTITYFEYGSAEKFAAEMIRLLNECKNAA